MRYRLKHVVEYAALRGMGFVMGHLPYRVDLAVGWLLAAVSYAVLRGRMRETRRRIRTVFGDSMTEAQVRKTAWHAWRHLAFTMIDVLRGPHLSPEEVRRWWDVRDIEVAARRLGEERRLIPVLPHLGSWEFAGIAMPHFGLPLVVIHRRQSNPLVDAYFHRAREHSGTVAVDRHGNEFRAVVRAIRNGRMLTILPDIRAHDDAVRVRFLGGEMPVAKGTVVLARLAHATLWPVYVLREGWTRHRLHFLEPVIRLDEGQGTTDEDIRKIMQQLFDTLEPAIRAHPEQYFWFNRRWLLDTPLANGPQKNVPEKV